MTLRNFATLFMIFARLPRATHRRLMQAGAVYHLWEATLDGGPEDELVTARLVCDWSCNDDAISRFLDALATEPA